MPGTGNSTSSHNHWRYTIGAASEESGAANRKKGDSMRKLNLEQVETFRTAVAELDAMYRDVPEKLADDKVEAELHAWLDGGDEPLPWKEATKVTSDEWFFVTTLYGNMTLKGQRTHIRRFFNSLFVDSAGGDIRKFTATPKSYKGLRSPYMATRLCRMAKLLKKQNMCMDDYVAHLLDLDSQATPDNPTPSLDRIVADHRATEWKSLSVFIRDCVQGNCFPIDSRVRKVLAKWNLPANEKTPVSLCLAIDRNPREIARMFYNAGGE